MVSRNLRFVFGAFLLGSLLWFSWWRGIFLGSRAAQVDARPALVVGTNVGYPPFIMTNEYGDVSGFDHAVASEIAQRMGCRIVLRNMAFDALLIALQKSKVDMIIGGISLTPSRNEKGVFLPYYGDVIKKVALFAKQGFDQVASLEELAQRGLRVCTQAGTVFSELLEKQDNLSLRILPDISDLVLEVQYGRSDVGVLDPDSVSFLASQQKNLAVHEVALAPRDYINGFGIGVHDATLRAQIGKVLDDMKRDGTMDRLMTQWFTSSLSA